MYKTRPYNYLKKLKVKCFLKTSIACVFIHKLVFNTSMKMKKILTRISTSQL